MAGVDLDPTHVTAFAVIPVALFVWFLVHRIRSRHNDGHGD